MATKTGELCPRCAVRGQEDELTGFCDSCTTERIVENYHAKDETNIARRREAWEDRTREARVDRGAATRERKRRQRLLDAVRPREAASRHADPFIIGHEAVTLLAQVRAALAHNGQVRFLLELDRAQELVRQLAWGPE